MAISVSGCFVWGALDVLEESACSSDSLQIREGDTALGMARGEPDGSNPVLADWFDWLVQLLPRPPLL